MIYTTVPAYESTLGSAESYTMSYALHLMTCHAVACLIGSLSVDVHEIASCHMMLHYNTSSPLPSLLKLRCVQALCSVYSMAHSLRVSGDQVKDTATHRGIEGCAGICRVQGCMGRRYEWVHVGVHSGTWGDHMGLCGGAWGSQQSAATDAKPPAPSRRSQAFPSGSAWCLTAYPTLDPASVTLYRKPSNQKAKP